MNEPGHAIAMHHFSVGAERIFDACLDPAWVGRWMFGPKVRDERIVRLTLDARVGGRFSFVVDRGGVEIEHDGEYLEIERPRRLAFTWRAGDRQTEPSRITIEITAWEQGCDVKLTQMMPAQWSAFAEKAAAAWSRMLDALARALAEEPSLPPRTRANFP